MSVIIGFWIPDYYNRHFPGGNRLLKFVYLMNENVLALMLGGRASIDTMPFPMRGNEN